MFFLRCSTNIPFSSSIVQSFSALSHVRVLIQLVFIIFWSAFLAFLDTSTTSWTSGISLTFENIALIYLAIVLTGIISLHISMNFTLHFLSAFSTQPMVFIFVLTFPLLQWWQLSNIDTKTTARQYFSFSVKCTRFHNRFVMNSVFHSIFSNSYFLENYEFLKTVIFKTCVDNICLYCKMRKMV